jgi:hypothetical protein
MLYTEKVIVDEAKKENISDVAITFKSSNFIYCVGKRFNQECRFVVEFTKTGNYKKNSVRIEY